MSFSEAGEWYEMSETDRLRRQENESLRAKNASLEEELAHLRAEAATRAAAAVAAAPEDDEAQEECPLPSGA